MERRCLFHDFLILSIDHAEGSEELVPQVTWRMPPIFHGMDTVSDKEIASFAFPYPELLKKMTAKSAPQADEFVFVLSKAGTSAGDPAMSRTFGFCRRTLGPGVSGRHDLGLRFPECICLLTTQPLFTLFPAILKVCQGLRLLAPEALADFVGRVCAPKPMPLMGESFRVTVPRPLAAPSQSSPAVTHVLPDELRFQMPASDSTMFADVPTAALLHALGPRRYVLFITALLLERRVIMVSNNLRKLTVCVHGGLAAIQPLTWQHIFIPLLPSRLLSYACAPYPFLIGLHGTHLEEILDPEGELALSEVLVVDLDRGELHVAGAAGPSSQPGIVRDIVGSGVLAPPRAVRRGADTLDGLRVRATRYLASRLEMLTPVEIASTVETYSEKTADAAQALSEKLHRVAGSYGGRTAAWRLAVTDAWADADAGRGEGVDPEAPPRADPRAAGRRAPEASAPTAAPAAVICGRGPDDAAVSEVLLQFLLELLGDPGPFKRDAAGIDGVRERFLASRSGPRRLLTPTDSPALGAFLSEFVHTQMFECFASMQADMGRAGVGGGGGGDDASDTPFFQCIATIALLGQPFDRKSIRRAVARLQNGEGSTGQSQRYHPVALALTSNTPYAGGDPGSTIANLCRVTARDAAQLGRVVRTIEWRLADCAGLKWRHGHKALLLLRGLLIYGPEVMRSLHQAALEHQAVCTLALSPARVLRNTSVRLDLRVLLLPHVRLR